MSTAFYGQPATIDQAPMPPAAVNIASSTNASPTVITTSGSHGLQTGQAVIINGHATNTNANGIWIATVTGATTLKISTFSGFPGTFINGNGVGGATGTVQSLALPGMTLPEDLVDNLDASSVNVPLEALADMTAWLAYKALANMTLLTGSTTSVDTTGTITITAASGTNNNALTAVGDGAGSGLAATGGGSSGVGVIGVGGATNGRGVVGIGKGTGSGMRASGSVAGSVGIEAVGTGSSVAIDVGTGNATFSGTAPTKTADPGAQLLASSNVPKAWGNISTDALAGITYNDGHSISTTTLNVGGYIVVTFARAFASTNYAPCATPLVTGQRQWIDIISTTVCHIYTTDLADAPIDPSTTVVKVALQVFGRQ